MNHENLYSEIERKRTEWLRQMAENGDMPLRLQTCDDLMDRMDLRLRQSLQEYDEDQSFWDLCLLQLSRIAETTWYRCGCGSIRPDAGMIDAFCEKCGEIRHVGIRLNRSPWPLCVAVLRRLRPDDWFEWLGQWISAQNLGHVITGDAYAQHSGAGEAYSSEAKNSEAGGDAYAQHSGEGGVAPIKIISCIDGMQIAQNGDIAGLNWISLPIPDSAYRFPNHKDLSIIGGARDR